MEIRLVINQNFVQCFSQWPKFTCHFMCLLRPPTKNILYCKIPTKCEFFFNSSRVWFISYSYGKRCLVYLYYCKQSLGQQQSGAEHLAFFWINDTCKKYYYWFQYLHITPHIIQFLHFIYMRNQVHHHFWLLKRFGTH